jgi:hypothetical protein
VDSVYNFYASISDPGEFYYINNNRSLCSSLSKELIVSNALSNRNMSKYGFSLERILIRFFVIFFLWIKKKSILRINVLSCYYNNEPCDFQSDFSNITSTTFGRCYTFNQKGVHMVKRNGIFYGYKNRSPVIFNILNKF